MASLTPSSIGAEQMALEEQERLSFSGHQTFSFRYSWLPKGTLAVKQDSVPGFINDSWATIEKPGIYRGQCAELCGKDHGFMPIVVNAVTESEYQQWLVSKKEEAAAAAASAEQEWSMKDLLARGETVYQANCSACPGRAARRGLTCISRSATRVRSRSTRTTSDCRFPIPCHPGSPRSGYSPRRRGRGSKAVW